MLFSFLFWHKEGLEILNASWKPSGKKYAMDVSWEKIINWSQKKKRKIMTKIRERQYKFVGMSEGEKD